MISINWKTGFWRLWIVLSFAWAGMVAYLELPKWFNGTQNTYYYSAAQNKVSGWYSDFPEERVFRDGQYLAINFPSNVTVNFLNIEDHGKKLVLLAPTEVTIAKWGKDPIFVPVEENKERLGAIGEVARHQRNQDQIRGISEALVWMLAPPVVLLGIGLAIGWILGGFKSEL